MSSSHKGLYINGWQKLLHKVWSGTQRVCALPFHMKLSIGVLCVVKRTCLVFPSFPLHFWWVSGGLCSIFSPGPRTSFFRWILLTLLVAICSLVPPLAPKSVSSKVEGWQMTSFTRSHLCQYLQSQLRVIVVRETSSPAARSFCPIQELMTVLVCSHSSRLQ